MPVREDGVVPDLVQLCVRQPQTRRKFDPDLLAVNHGLDPAVADIHDGEELIDREVALGAVAELPRDIAGIVGKRVGGIASMPAALVLQRLRQVPVIEGRKGFDAGFEKRIEKAVIEIEALWVRSAAAGGEGSRAGG